jgi:hypothetical protein
MHCWPNSTLSSDLSAAGHKVVAAGEGERNLTSRHRAAIHADIIGGTGAYDRRLDEAGDIHSAACGHDRSREVQCRPAARSGAEHDPIGVASAKGVRQPIHCRVFPVLALDPVLRPAALVGTVAIFRDQTFQTHIRRTLHMCAGIDRGCVLRGRVIGLPMLLEDRLRPAR